MLNRFVLSISWIVFSWNGKFKKVVCFFNSYECFEFCCFCNYWKVVFYVCSIFDGIIIVFYYKSNIVSLWIIVFFDVRREFLDKFMISEVVCFNFFIEGNFFVNVFKKGVEWLIFYFRYFYLYLLKMYCWESFVKVNNRCVYFLWFWWNCMIGFVINVVDCKVVIENYEGCIVYFFRVVNVWVGLDVIYSFVIGVVVGVYFSKKCYVFENCYIFGIVFDSEIFIIFY